MKIFQLEKMKIFQLEKGKYNQSEIGNWEMTEEEEEEEEEEDENKRIRPREWARGQKKIRVVQNFKIVKRYCSLSRY